MKRYFFQQYSFLFRNRFETYTRSFDAWNYAAAHRYAQFYAEMSRATLIKWVDVV